MKTQFIRRTPVRKSGRRGFALVISLSLMILLVVLALGLMNLSGITLRSSQRGDAMATARANARMALVMAIGQLQKLTGPDQRVTAPADLAGKADGDRLEDGAAPANNMTVTSTPKGLSAVQPGTRYWTGVWRNANTTNPETLIYTKTPSPEFMQWLVSGNEGSGSLPKYTPASGSVAVGNGGSVASSTDAVVLVGKHTAGGGGSDALDRYVSAPLVNIADSRSTTAKHPAGRSAWWVGDEGVKAKLNMTPAQKAEKVATYAGLAARRRGWETVDGFGSYPTPDAASDALVGRVATLPQAALLDSSLNSGSDPALGRAFHSATTDSFGVISDTLQGGLRLDLSAYLADTLPGQPVKGVTLNSIQANTNIIPRTVASKLQGPKWDQLRDFYTLGQTLGTNGVLEVKAAAKVTDTSIAPLITDFRLLFGVKLVAAGTDSYKVYPCAKVAISIANPYSRTLKWTTPLEVEVKNVTDPGRRPSCVWEAAGQPAYIPRATSEPAALNNAIFTIASGSLAPGEAKAYTMSQKVERPVNSTAKVTIPLVDFSSSGASNFDKSIQLAHGSTNSVAGGAVMRLDVREDATTTQINVELRSAGSTSILRKIERFELDNAPFDVTQRVINSANAKLFTQPFPLQFYSYQISQPGADYGALLPSRNDLGLRGSTLRTYTDFNLQATRFRKPIISYTPPPYFMLLANSSSALPFVAPGGETGLSFTRDLNLSPLPWGRSPADAKNTILFSPPQSLVSLAQLQHADLTADDIYVSVGHQPGNAVGNSYASPFVPRVNSFKPRTDFTITNFSNYTTAQTNYYDIAYLLNTALWDTYYFSTMPRSGQTVPLNACIVKIDSADTSKDLLNGELAAGRLLIDGAQSVNCTDKDAWKALLASSKHLRHPADTSDSSDALFPRSLEQTNGAHTPPTGNDPDSFAGFRRLNDAQLELLAEELAKQVRLRGPFVSLSQFVNRALVAVTATTGKELGRAGTLQAAIDASGANISPDGTKNLFADIDPVEDRVMLRNDGSAPRADLTGGDSTSLSNSPPDGTWPPTSLDLNPGSIAGILADKQILTDRRYQIEQGFRSTGIPGWLTQADVLQVIGPALSARSDTFRVRAYGEALDPETGNPVAKAWCEAIVQRMPAYVDGTNLATDRGDALSSVNRTFGRRFEMVSFKWLSPNEI